MQLDRWELCVSLKETFGNISYSQENEDIAFINRTGWKITFLKDGGLSFMKGNRFIVYSKNGKIAISGYHINELLVVNDDKSIVHISSEKPRFHWTHYFLSSNKESSFNFLKIIILMG